jgi:hypothetical protein
VVNIDHYNEVLSFARLELSRSYKLNDNNNSITESDRHQWYRFAISGLHPSIDKLHATSMTNQ